MSSEPSWPTVVRFAREAIEDARTQLETAPLEAVPKLQARIRAFQDLLALPSRSDPRQAVGEASAYT
jgi:hypothetical protein